MTRDHAKVVGFSVAALLLAVGATEGQAQQSGPTTQQTEPQGAVNVGPIGVDADVAASNVDANVGADVGANVGVGINAGSGDQSLTTSAPTGGDQITTSQQTTDTTQSSPMNVGSGDQAIGSASPSTTGQESGTSASGDANVGANVDANVGIGANVGSGSQTMSTTLEGGGDQVTATQQTNETSVTGQTSVTTDSQTTETQGSSEGSASPRFKDDEEKKTGLDRADEAAGSHGQHGRDNAREKQMRY